MMMTFVCVQERLYSEKDLHRKLGLLKIKCDQGFCKYFGNHKDDDDDGNDDDDDDENDDDGNDDDENDDESSASKKT